MYVSIANKQYTPIILEKIKIHLGQMFILGEIVKIKQTQKSLPNFHLRALLPCNRPVESVREYSMCVAYISKDRFVSVEARCIADGKKEPLLTISAKYY